MRGGCANLLTACERKYIFRKIGPRLELFCYSQAPTADTSRKLAIFCISKFPRELNRSKSLKTETHLFLFDSLPKDPREALQGASSAAARYICRTLGAENRQGNREVAAHWRIDGTTKPVLTPVPSTIYRPNTPTGMQQVRAEVLAETLGSFEYLFEREKVEWDPQFSTHEDPSRPDASGLWRELNGQMEAREWAHSSARSGQGNGRSSAETGCSRFRFIGPRVTSKTPQTAYPPTRDQGLMELSILTRWEITFP